MLQSEKRVVTPVLASVSEACEYLAVSRPTVDRMIANGELEACRIGAHWRIQWDSLRRVAKEGAKL